MYAYMYYVCMYVCIYIVIDTKLLLCLNFAVDVPAMGTAAASFTHTHTHTPLCPRCPGY